MSLFIVSGQSGSGKSIALHALEDHGFYCIDNLPARLLPQLAREVIESDDPNFENVAVGMDVRNKEFLAEISDHLQELKAAGLDYRIIYLEADESILVKRYKETRRKHPLTNDNVSLLEGIALEKELLDPLARQHSIRIDTTHTTPQTLRKQVIDFVVAQQSPGATLLFKSFGFKHGTPLDADFVFDIRCLPNPYWQQELRKYSGLDEPVIAFLERQEEVTAMFNDICTFIEKWIPYFEREQRTYLTIAIGCTGGQHRSVYLSEKLARYFSKQKIRTQVRHRELS